MRFYMTLAAVFLLTGGGFALLPAYPQPGRPSPAKGASDLAGRQDQKEAGGKGTLYDVEIDCLRGAVAAKMIQCGIAYGALR